MKKIIVIFCLLLSTGSISAQVKIIPRAHAHNDYEHLHPLKDAMTFGFTSVESDVYLIGNDLFVAHNKPEKIDSTRTLTKLYLQPLQKLAKAQKGKMYKGYEGVFYLMIDLKNDPVNTFTVLKQQLSLYPELVNNPYFKIYLSGANDRHFVLDSSTLNIGIDGRLPDLGKGYTAEQMPVISESFSTITKWDGHSPVTLQQFELVKEFISKVHLDGKKSRLWAIPDHIETWKRLYEYGMDFINTDKLEELSKFL